MTAPDILAVARWLQDRHGLYLFTVDHPGRPECGGSHRECNGQRGKHPRGRWPRLATLSHRLIAAQLACGPWNLGIACKPSSLLVVDEDRPDAYADFAAAVGMTIEPTLTVRTAKGRHYYYRQVEGAPFGNGRGRMADRGIDVRGGGDGDGGYVVAPGSVHHTGVIYTPIDSSMPIRPMPYWLVEALVPSQVHELRNTARQPASVSGMLRGVVRFMLEATPESDRNTRLYWSACRAAEMVEKGAVDEATVTLVLADAAVRTGLPEPEALRTIRSAMNAVARGHRG